MMTSSLIDLANSGRISGSGLDMANMTGFLAKFLTISSVNIPGWERPTNTSAPSEASARVLLSVLAANYYLIGFNPSLPSYITPYESQRMQFSGLAPYSIISLRQAIPAAPAPFKTIFTSSIFFSWISKALIKPAKHTIAVPC